MTIMPAQIHTLLFKSLYWAYISFDNNISFIITKIGRTDLKHPSRYSGEFNYDNWVIENLYENKNRFYKLFELNGKLNHENF